MVCNYGVDFSKYSKFELSEDMLDEISMAERAGYDVSEYISKGYCWENIHFIVNVKKYGFDVMSYITPDTDFKETYKIVEKHFEDEGYMYLRNMTLGDQIIKKNE